MSSNLDFDTFYLQRTTCEFAEDLDAVRGADDFKADQSVSFLVHTLQQGTALYPAPEQARILTTIQQGADGMADDANGRACATPSVYLGGIEEQDSSGVHPEVKSCVGATNNGSKRTKKRSDRRK